MIERKGELIAGHAEVAKRIPADQHRGRRHRAGEHPGRQADIPAEELPSPMAISVRCRPSPARAKVAIFPSRKNRKVGSRFYADAK